MRLFPIEFEAGGQTVSVLAQPRQSLLATTVASNAELPRSGDRDFDVVAFLFPQRLDHSLGQAHRQTVALFSGPHVRLRTDEPASGPI